MKKSLRKDAMNASFFSFIIMWKAVKDNRNGFVGLVQQIKK
jgi:hypothetical protein